MAIDLNKIPREKREEILALLEEKARRLRQRKIWTYYPDEGPLRRELYPKHMEFFKAGAIHRERMVLAANRVGKCTTAETLIDTPDGKVRMGDLYQNKRKFRVYAWDGEKIVEADALPPFKKGSEPCVRVSLSSGAWVDTALGHRVLTNRGWNTISDCLPGRSKQSFESFQGTSSALFPVTRSSSAACLKSSVSLPSPITLSHSPTISYNPIGRNDVYDFEVPKYHNYIAGDMIHHNTEGLGGYETTLHLTGLYPDWWEGKRFNGPIRAWAAGTSGKTVRDILQYKLLGPMGDMGTGLIPGELIKNKTSKPGVPNAIDQLWVEHISGRNSELTFKSFDQGTEAFQGAEIDLIWLDEECPVAILEESVIRTMATGKFKGGIVILTFTPLLGMSDVVLKFLPEGKIPQYGMAVVQDDGSTVYNQAA